MKFSLFIISTALIASVVAAAPVTNDKNELSSRDQESQEFISPYSAVFRRDEDDATGALNEQKQGFISPYKYVFRRDEESTEFIPAGKYVFRRDLPDALKSQKQSWINNKAFVFRRTLDALFGSKTEKRKLEEVTGSEQATGAVTNGFIPPTKYVF